MKVRLTRRGRKLAEIGGVVCLFVIIGVTEPMSNWVAAHM